MRPVRRFVGASRVTVRRNPHSGHKRFGFGKVQGCQNTNRSSASAKQHNTSHVSVVADKPIPQSFARPSATIFAVTRSIFLMFAILFFPSRSFR
jgi:hypothetical protein